MSPRTRSVALATAAAAGGLDEDMLPLLAALAARDLVACEAVWDDPAVDWGRFDAVVVRSTWDYFARRDEFLGWARRVAAATRLHNPAAVLEWTTDKRYLVDLDRAGVPVVPTVFLEPGEGGLLGKLGDLAEQDLIVKPAISAGSNDTARHCRGERAAAAAHVGRLLAAGRPAMLQPYQAAVDEQGETALVFFDGQFSHAIRKGAIFARDPGGPDMVGGLFAREEIAPRQPSAAERRVADATLAALRTRLPGVRQPLLYARVDLVPLQDGTPAVLELELCEPSVFLDHSLGSAERFAAAIVHRLEEPR